MKTESFFFPLAAISAFLLFGSCQGRQDPVTTLDFWALGNEGENVQKLLPDFESKNPGIRVKVQQIPWTAAHEKLLTAYAGNSLPDLWQLGNTWIPEFSSLDALLPLNSLITESEGIVPSDYFQGVWDTNVIDSVVFGLPWYVDTRILFYRTDILEEAGFSGPPKTWDEWKEASRRIVRSGRSKRYGIFLPTNEWQPAVILGLEAGSPLLKENSTRGDFSGERFTFAFQYLRSFYQEGLSPSSWLEIQNIYQGFAEGYIAMYITGPWQIGEFRRRLPREIQSKWMTSPLPGLKEGRPGLSLAGGSSLVISKNTPHRFAAWKLIEYLSRPDIQVRFFAQTGNLPARRKAWEDPMLRGDRYIQAFLRQLEYVTPTPKIPEWEQIASKVMEHVEMSASSATRQSASQSDKEILAALDRVVDRILEKRRWLADRGLAEQSR